MFAKSLALVALIGLEHAQGHIKYGSTVYPNVSYHGNGHYHTHKTHPSASHTEINTDISDLQTEINTLRDNIRLQEIDNETDCDAIATL